MRFITQTLEPTNPSTYTESPTYTISEYKRESKIDEKEN